MSILALSVLFVILLLVCLVSGIWIFLALITTGIVALHTFMAMDLERIGNIAAQVIWRSASVWELAAIPIFLLMGEIALHSQISERMFRGLVPLVRHVPGQLLHVNIVGSTIFAAFSGSSVATTTTIGRLTIPKMRELGYQEKMIYGSLAGAGTLGLMIPPSVSIIVFGVLAEQSIARLFAAGIAPGLLLAGFFASYIVIRCLKNPALAPYVDESEEEGFRLFSIVTNLLPVGTIIIFVFGSMYGGFATPTEAAVIGLGTTLVMTGLTGGLGWSTLRQSFVNSARTSAMVLSIVVAAGFLGAVISFLGIPRWLSAYAVSLELGPTALILVLSIAFLFLGAFLDGLAIMAITVPLIVPIAVTSGIDPIWFGIYMVLISEMALITPPVGISLFVLQGLSGRNLSTIAISAFPFLTLMCLVLVILYSFPEVVLWFPNQLY